MGLKLDEGALGFRVLVFTWVWGWSIIKERAHGFMIWDLDFRLGVGPQFHEGAPDVGVLRITWICD